MTRLAKAIGAIGKNSPGIRNSDALQDTHLKKGLTVDVAQGIEASRGVRNDWASTGKSRRHTE